MHLDRPQPCQRGQGGASLRKAGPHPPQAALLGAQDGTLSPPHLQSLREGPWAQSDGQAETGKEREMVRPGGPLPRHLPSLSQHDI